MTHQRIDLRINTGKLDDGKSWTLGLTVHLPEPAKLRERPAVLVGLPGGRYSRHYFDLREPGYSQAEHHCSRGVVVIAIDHLRVGDSDMPELDAATLPACAAANHAVLGVVLDRLQSGSLESDVAPIRPAAIVGAGQSMGGHIALLMQVNHDSFDGLAMLGASVTRTRLQSAIPGQDVCFAGKPGLNEISSALRAIDLRFAFHWEDVPERFSKVDMDSKNGLGPIPYWGSALTPDATAGVFPGYFTGAAAQVTAPTLVAMGERDVCQDPLRELAAYMSARDLAQFVVPRMAHMHNFAGTRELLWRRLDAFISQVGGRPD